ncbi:MAG: putative O-glycosylation ligase, exosortase A system-associated, partial [Steroidobacteraceae bacterium]
MKGPFFGILMWFWLSMMSPQKLVWYGFFSQIPYDLIVAVTTFLAWVVKPGEPRMPPLDKTTVLLLLLMFWISITSLMGIGPSDQIFDKWQLTEKMLLMTVAAYILTNTQPRLDQLVAVVVLSIAFYGLRGGVFAILTGGAFRVYGPNGTMTGDNNDLGVALTMTLPLLFYLRERYSRPALKWPMLALIGLTIFGDIFTYSRGALVAVIAMSGVLWLRSRKKIATMFIIVIAAVGIWNFAPEKWFERMLSIESYQHDQSAESRL